jgi:hypothetical protein
MLNLRRRGPVKPEKSIDGVSIHPVISDVPSLISPPAE